MAPWGAQRSIKEIELVASLTAGWTGIAIGILVLAALGAGGLYLYFKSKWFKKQVQNLASVNAATRDAAIREINDRIRRTMACVIKGLASGKDEDIRDACLVLQVVEGNAWKAARPQLEEILSCPPSARTDAVSAFFYNKGLTFDMQLSWEQFENQPEAQRNICIYVLVHENNNAMRCRAAIILGELGDGHAIEPLKRAAADKDENLQRYASIALKKAEQRRYEDEERELFDQL